MDHSAASSGSVPRKATRREWIGLGVIALPCLLYSMDLTVLNLAVPAIMADLNPSATQLLWIVDIYGFMIAGMLITMGTLGDRIGRRKLLMIGAFAFGLASILAAFSTSAEMLIVARAILGLSAATLAPSTLSLISNMFPDPKERTFAIGVWISSFSAGGAIGPVIGGILLTWFWWGSVFLIAVPVMVVLLIVAPFLLPEYRDENAGRIDLVSVALSLATIYGIKHAASYAFDGEAAIAILGGLAIGFVFVLRQSRLATPLIDLSLFKSLKFSASLGINTLGFFAAFGIFLLTAQYLQLVLGLSPLAAGLWGAPSSIGFIVGSLLSPKLLAAMRPGYVMAGGYALTAVSFVVMPQAAAAGSLYLLVVSHLLMSFGLAPIFTLSTDLIIGTVPPERAGTAAGLSETSAEFGGALGIAILGSIVTALYAGSMVAFDGSGLAADALANARATIGGAVAEAVEVGGATGELLLDAARTAYADAFYVVTLVCAVVSLLAAVVSLLVLGRIKPDAGDTSDAKECGAEAMAP
ncbi:MAG: MFS transporter [Mesorhizobium sp.]|nr:MFS transporter [Mesorhizobium sp.]MBL8578430.1 MFS transporter [Mesorhizobium sp.]